MKEKALAELDDILSRIDPAGESNSALRQVMLALACMQDEISVLVEGLKMLDERLKKLEKAQKQELLQTPQAEKNGRTV